jgi:hypothetical protein
MGHPQALSLNRHDLDKLLLLLLLHACTSRLDILQATQLPVMLQQTSG